MFKKITILIFLILEIYMLTVSQTVLADDEDFSEELSLSEIENLLNDDVINASSNQIEEPKINSRSSVIIDRNNLDVLYGKNENKRVAMASTTKIMTALIVIEKANLDDIVKVPKKAAMVGGSRLKLNTDDEISVHDLLYGLMLRSGNDAAVCLAIHIGGSIEEFANIMNQKAKQIGLKDTNFVTPHGLDDPNHYTTAFELAKLTDYALKNETFSKIVRTKTATITINNKSRTISNTNELLGYLNGVYGVKTGFTNNAGRCLVTAIKRDNIDIICVVLGADTKKLRTKDSIKLIEYVFKNFQKVDIEEISNKEFNSWKNINKNRILLYKARNNLELEISNLEKKEILVRKDKIGNIKTETTSLNYLEAPVENNTRIGTIKLKLDDKVVEEVYIRLSESLMKKTCMDYFKESLKILLAT